MDLLQLQYFKAIAELGSMSSAARSLYVSQPNLSVSMTRLEEELGVALFDRRRGRIELTESGKIFLKYVNKMFIDLDSGLSRIRAFSSDSNAQISIATSLTELVGNVMQRMGPQVRDIRIKQMTCQNEQIRNLVLNGEADLGIIIGERTGTDLEYYLLGEFERVAVVSKDHPLAGEWIVSLNELKEYYFILNRNRDDEPLFQHIGNRYGIFPIVNCECDDDLMELVVQQENDYVSLCPIPTVLKEQNRIPQFQVKILSVKEELPTAKIWMVRRVGHHPGPTALKFEKAAVEYYKMMAERAGQFKRNL